MLTERQTHDRFKLVSEASLCLEAEHNDLSSFPVAGPVWPTVGSISTQIKKQDWMKQQPFLAQRR